MKTFLTSILSILANFLPLSLHLPACEAFEHANAVKKTDEEHAASLISWLQKEGGYFNPKLQMRRLDPSDPSSFFGMYTNDDIEEDEVLLRVPYSMVLTSEEEDPDVSIITCPTVRNLIEQLKLKDESKYAPYVNYLLDTQPPGSMPSSWSEAGKALFKSVLGGYGDYPIKLPLQDDPFPWVQEWHTNCDGSDDPLEEYAALLVVQRSWDDIMIPVMDMLSHRNGYWLNSYHTDFSVEMTSISRQRGTLRQKNRFIHPITCARIVVDAFILMEHPKFSENTVSSNRCPRHGSSEIILNLGPV
jgi:hypothetical protein